MIISRLCCSNLLTQYVLPLPVGPAINMVNGCCKITCAASNSNVFDITDSSWGCSVSSVLVFSVECGSCLPPVVDVCLDD